MNLDLHQQKRHPFFGLSTQAKKPAPMEAPPGAQRPDNFGQPPGPWVPPLP